jgi:predicted metal-dependent enzyme (double-stranded beta helix superfamily)
MESFEAAVYEEIVDLIEYSRWSDSDSSDSPRTPDSLGPIRGFAAVEAEIKDVFESCHDWPSRQTALFNILDRAVLSPAEVAKFAHFNANFPYTRNLVTTDDKNFTLLLLCWNPGMESPIHDHPCDGCFIKAIQGTVCETRYIKDPASDELKVLDKTCVSDGVVTYMDDFIGFHKVGNNGTEPAITLHLYTPPYQLCKVCCGLREDVKCLCSLLAVFIQVWASPEQFSAWTEGKVTFYSQYGSCPKQRSNGSLSHQME